MAVIAGERKAIPSANPPKPPTLQNPWHVSNTAGQSIITNHPAAGPQIVGQAMNVPIQTAPGVPVAPPPPPLNFKALTEGDSEYIEGKNLLSRQNQLSKDALAAAFARDSQSSQDSFNAHGALYSGAAANAQKSLARSNDAAALQQALDYDQGGHNLYHSVFNRLVNQLGGGSSAA